METMLIITLVSTVLTSGAFAGLVTYKLNSRRDDRLFKQQRLEDLHEAFFAVANGVSAGWAPYLAVITGKISYNQALDLSTTGSERRPLPVARLQMLASLYHPQVLPMVEHLLEIRDDAGRTIFGQPEKFQKLGRYPVEITKMDGHITQLSALEESFYEMLRELSLR